MELDDVSGCRVNWTKLEIYGSYSGQMISLSPASVFSSVQWGEEGLSREVAVVRSGVNYVACMYN